MKGRLTIQKILLEISNGIIGTLDYEKVLQIISNGMSELLTIETAAIYLIEKNDELFLGATTPPLDPMMPAGLRVAKIHDHPHIGTTIRTKMPQIIEDTTQVQLSENEKIVVDLRKLQSILYLPFIQENNVLGVLILGTTNTKRHFSESEIELGQTVANQLSIGMQNARLHHELKLNNKNLQKEIRDRQKIESELRKSELHLSNALRIAMLGHWEYDIEKDLFTFNDEFYSVNRSSADAMGGYTMDSNSYLSKFVHPDDIHLFEKGIQMAMEASHDDFSNEIEHRVLFGDGTTGFIIVRYKIIKNSEGKTIKTLGVNQDITKRKQIEQQLLNAIKKEEETAYLYRNLFDQAAEGICLMTLEGRFYQVNNAFAKMHGYSVDEVMKLEIFDLDVYGRGSISDRQHLMQRAIKGECVYLEVQHFHKDGHIFPLGVISQILQINNINYLLCFHQDLTHQKRIEQEISDHRDNLKKLVDQKTTELDCTIVELKKANEALSEKNSIINKKNYELSQALQNLQETQALLIQAEKMASLGVLTAGIAHEINNPLNYIMGAYSALKDYFEEKKMDDTEFSTKILQILKSGLDKATNIVQGLNLFSRNTSLLTEQCHLETIINNCLTMLNHKIKGRIKVKKEFQTKDVVIEGNNGQLHQAFLNVLQNSVQAIKSNGTIRIGIQKTNENIILEFSDDGVGIEQKNLSRITDPFFTTKEPGEGTGLGLSITYSIIKEHKGKLEFDSDVNKGTLVKITLPLNPA